MLLRHGFVIVAVIAAGFLAYIISRSSGGNPAQSMQLLLYAFTGLLVAGFAWWRYHEK